MSDKIISKVDIKEHQAWVASKPDETLTREQNIVKYAFGLPEEVGEVLSIIKKSMFNGKPVDAQKLKLELGDVSWYLIALIDALGYDFDEILQLNRVKLDTRYKDKYSHEESLKRVDLVDSK